jgi:uncharacterized protein with NRDE domain
MCLALFALDAHPRYALVVAANRDEYHARPTSAAAWWDEGWLAGRDLRAGGTWFGVTPAARWAFVTNVREPARHDPDAPSRGSLVPAVLADAQPPTSSVGRIVAAATAQNGFNLVAGESAQAAWGSNRAIASRSLSAGIHGVSNATLDTPWPKVTRTMAVLAKWCEAAESDIAPLFAMLADTRAAPDAELPATGVTLERERLLSAPFIVSAAYGTRCSTVLMLTRDGTIRFVERSFDANGKALRDVEHRFAVTRELKAPPA